MSKLPTKPSCRRYRVAQVTFDTRNTLLDTVIEDHWEPEIQEMWRVNQSNIRMDLINELGTKHGERKIKNYRLMGSAPWSIVFEHNKLLRQVRSAFGHGDFYPALVGACALGERIFNELILVLREDFINHPATTRKVRNVANGSFHDWGAAVAVLRGWGVLDEATASTYLSLEKRRHAAVHFDPSVLADDRDSALEALNDVQSIIESLFSPHGGPPVFIADTPGVNFISYEAEQIPIIRRVFVPQCVLVSPRHTLEPEQTIEGTSWTVHDDADYEHASLTDEEFAEAFRNGGTLLGR